MWLTDFTTDPRTQGKWEVSATLSDETVFEYHEPVTGCCRMCYDCEAGGYCWASDANEEKNR